MRKSVAFLTSTALFAGISMAATTFPIVIPSSRAAIDLDVPGALESLQRDHPSRYAQVMEAVEREQQLPPLDEKPSVRNLYLDPAAHAQRFMLTHPAKRHVTVFADGVEYKISAYFTADPARIQKAR